MSEPRTPKTGKVERQNGSRKVRKSESPEDSIKSKVESTKSKEGNTSASGSDQDNIANSEINDKSEIEHPKSEIKTMEVHHHPEVEKKGLKEYNLHGLMIFLAVMMGFFAESYREHLSEHSKEREYAINIKKDLVTDTLNLNIWIPSLYNRVLGFDTLITYLETPGPVKNGSDMYYRARLSTRNSIFEPSDNTILEMKSSGNLRLIQNRDIVNGLMDFERSLAQYTNLFDIDNKEDILTYPLLGELFDAKVFNKMVFVQNKDLTEKEYARGSTNNTLRPPGNPQLLTRDMEKINLLIYYLHQRKSSFMGEIRRLQVQKEVAEKLIAMINKEYKLQDE
ncbi:hypothetical protein [Mucilaginibacter sp.]|uniref:hypothetical protein n=1 Tax=Mucilaginibacter sp. TaxID=1882438 RepID=UPI002849D1BB|nr:hypothetical protein [Mucilaginibacter sp.]MDR3695378.1 hypothetical protein [Mucilaginibacter sp.]